MKRKSLLFPIVLLLLSACASRPEAVERGQHPQSAVVQGVSREVTLNYLLYIPEAYGRNRDEEWPLILFLHGMGERGDNLNTLLAQPLPQTLATDPDFPFIVVSPQLPTAYSAWTVYEDALLNLLDQIAADYAVDESRVYITGLSMGGFATWNIILRYPERFAAAVPIAGGYMYNSSTTPTDLGDIVGLPIWVFHGLVDTTVRERQSAVLVDALRALGSPVRYTVYEDAGHVESWVRAYADPELWSWLAEQRRP